MADTEDAYTEGELTRLLQGQSGNQSDAFLASLFSGSAADQSDEATGKKRKQPEADEEADDGIAQATQKKKKSKKSPTTGGGDTADPEAAAADRAKARAHLVQTRERRRLEDPRNTRTVFVGNVASAAKKRNLLLLFRAHGPIESVRFRSAAPTEAGIVKRLAVIHKKLARPSLNAYIVYKEVDSVAKATEALNGHLLCGMHLRVDSLPGNEGFQRDGSRCVFLGNLHFKCDEESVRSAFGQCGKIANVRLVRDSRTGIGRGFGFVQFADAASVELALRLAGTEVTGRALRVTRCSDSAKTAAAAAKEKENKKMMKMKMSMQRADNPEETEAADRRELKRKLKKKREISDSKNDNNRDNKNKNKKGKPTPPASRPTNRTFAQAFQQTLDRRRSRAAGGGARNKKGGNPGKGMP